MPDADVYGETIEEIADNVVTEGSLTIVGIILLQIIVCVIGIAILILIIRYSRRIKLENKEMLYKHLRTLVLQVVNTKNQLVVDIIKTESRDGKLTEEQSKQVFNDVKEKVLSLLSGNEIAYLKERYGDSNIGVGELIEDAVRRCKMRTE